MAFVDDDVDAAAASSQGCWYERPAKKLDHAFSCGRVRLQVRERPDGAVGTGGEVWSASRALVRYLSDEGRFPGEAPFAGWRVIEVGAGVGLPGLACAALGADATLTDEERVLRVMQENVQANFAEGNSASSGCCRAAVLSWGQDSSHLKPPFDLVLGADVLYLPETYDALVSTLDALLGTNGLCIFAWERRSALESRFVDLAGEKFEVTDLFKDLDDGAQLEFANVTLISLRRSTGRDGP